MYIIEAYYAGTINLWHLNTDLLYLFGILFCIIRLIAKKNEVFWPVSTYSLVEHFVGTSYLHLQNKWKLMKLTSPIRGQTSEFNMFRINTCRNALHVTAFTNALFPCFSVILVTIGSAFVSCNKEMHAHVLTCIPNSRYHTSL